MFWSGSNAMFTGIWWNGAESQVNYPILGNVTTDYWRNVINAFETSRSLAIVGNLLPGFDKTIAAFSMGNVVVSSAIVDHGLRVSNYYMINSSAALEAYAEGARNRDEMRHPDWHGYEEYLWSTEWYELFDKETDARSRMTWRGRFGPLNNAYNFYSTGEEVLRNGTGEVPDIRRDRSWVFQEMTKGDPDLSGGGIFHNASGGWVFSEYWRILVKATDTVPSYMRRRTPEEATKIPKEQLGQHPFFKPFYFNEKIGERDFHDPVQGPIAARSYDRVSRALAESLPALSFATGSNPSTALELGRNFNMMDLRSGWPESRLEREPGERGWLHSDIRRVAYLYTFKVFDRFIEFGGLDQ